MCILCEMKELLGEDVVDEFLQQNHNQMDNPQASRALALGVIYLLTRFHLDNVTFDVTEMDPAALPALRLEMNGPKITLARADQQEMLGAMVSAQGRVN